MTFCNAQRFLCLAIVLSSSSLSMAVAGDTGGSQSLTKEERLEWFKEAKFGLFIHWGPYALGGECAV